MTYMDVGYPASESVSPNALGFAVAHRGDSKYASVFRGRVLAMVGRGGPCSEAELLGHAMARELGHLLLGTSAHSRYGLMAARWRATDLDRAAVGGLLFSPAEAAIMRAEAVRRWDKSRVAPLTNLSERKFSTPGDTGEDYQAQRCHGVFTIAVANSPSHKQSPSRRHSVCIVRDSEKARCGFPLEMPTHDTVPAHVARRILSELSASGYRPG